VPRSIDFDKNEMSFTPLQNLASDVVSQIKLRLHEMSPLRAILRKIAAGPDPNFTLKERQLIKRLLTTAQAAEEAE
jgi:hypothetical protein